MARTDLTAADADVTKKPPMDARDPEPHRHFVLVVDNDVDTRDALAILLEGYDVATATASNGREALEILRAGPVPCLILLDLAMPEMDGFAFRRTQLASPALADVPVAVLSATGIVDEEHARRLGMHRFFRKPCEIDELLDVVRSHCPPATTCDTS